MPTKADAKKGEKKKRTYRCLRCIKAGVPEEDATFVGFNIYGNHMREHKAKDAVDLAIGVATTDEPQEPVSQGPVPADIRRVRKPTPLDHDLNTLRGVLADAGIGARLDSIVSAFRDWDDLAEFDRLLSMAGVMIHAKRMALLVWAQHRGIAPDYVHKHYPTAATTTSVDSVVQPVVDTKPVDPFDSMMTMMEKQMRMQMMQQQMQMMRAGMTFGPDGRATGEMPKPSNPVMEMLNNQLQMEMMQSQLQQLRSGARLGTDGKPIGEAKEEKMMRQLQNGSSVEMTDKQWIAYQTDVERQKTQLLLQATKEETKRESEKIPIKIDGQIVHVPADQVDKYIMLSKSMEPDQKKDVFVMLQEMEKGRSELQQQHLAEMQMMRDKQNDMVLARQEQMIQRLQSEMQNRPNPIAEMVSTQAELKDAGILSEGTKDIDQHNMAIQEKKLDTTMDLILQQQSAMNQKTNQLITVLTPIAQQYAQEAAQNLPKPGETRDSFRDKRKAVAQEIMPLDEQDARAMEHELAQEVGEEPPPRKKESRVLTVGDVR